MADLSFSQSERRSFLVPALLAFAVLAVILATVFLYLPYRVANIAITHTAILPTHTVYKSDTKLVGHPDDAQDDLYVLATLHIDDRLHVPLFLNDISGTLTTADGGVVTSSAVEKNDLDSLYLTFPALQPLAGPPLLRESTIQPGDHADGMVILHFPVTEADWNNRSSATVTLTFYHQDPITVTIPKDQGTGSSK